MDGDTLVRLLISFMDDEEINEPFAYQLLNMAKDKIEMSRMWVKLRKPSDSFDIASSDGYLDFQDLPDDFLMTFGDKPLKLISGSDVIGLSEIPLDERDKYRDNTEVFYIDYNGNRFAILGGLSQGYSATLYYIASTDDIESGKTWIFPKMAHPLLVIEALIIHRGQVDFDNINARMVNEGYGTKKDMENALIMWDANLQARAGRGRKPGDPFKRSIN